MNDRVMEYVTELLKVQLPEAKEAIERVEGSLSALPFVVAHTFSIDGRALHVAITDRLRRRCRKGRVWKSPAFLTAFKNAQYGFDPNRAHSPGGADGIFVLTRSHKPANAMMKKVFDRFLDKPDSGAKEIADCLGAELQSLIPVRLVSHHLRLLGCLHRGEREDMLVLVDYDDE